MSELTNRQGVAAAQLAVSKIGWFFREQPISDRGVDAIVEEVVIVPRESKEGKEEGTGRLLALQIKGGRSWFDESSPGGWWFRFESVHAERWLNLAIPVVVVLVDTATDACYWQEISPRTIVGAGHSYKVEVPSTQVVRTAAAEWSVLVSRAATEATSHYEDSLAHLPPSVAMALRELGSDIDLDPPLLAYHLAEGRQNPEGTVQALLAAEPLWVTRGAPKSWEAIGTYASSYEVFVLAAEALQRAAATGDEAERGRLLADAAVLLVHTDSARARALIDEADAVGAPAEVVAVVRAVLAHPEGDASPIDLPEMLDIEQETVRRSPFVQCFLAIRSQHAGETEVALRHSALALNADPESTTVMAHRAKILLWASHVGHSDPELPAKGMEMLKQAIAQQHQWDGPTLDLTLLLARTSMSRGLYETALDACLAAPDGNAAVAVARDARVMRLALVAAAGLNRYDLAHRIDRAMGDSDADRLSKCQAGLLEATDDELRTWLRADLDDAIAQGDFIRMAQGSLALAELGVDTSDVVGPLVTRSILPESTPQLISALVTARHDLERALPRLRALARTDRDAGIALVKLLLGAERAPEALSACEMILAVRRDPATIAARAQLLILLEDPKAEQSALDAASELGGFTTVRRGFLTYAAQKAAERNEWELAEGRLQEVLAFPGPVEDDAVWRLVMAQLQRGHPDRAAYTIDMRRPQVRTLNEAKLWILARAATGLGAATAAEALALAERFNDPEVSPAFLSLIVQHTNGEDLHADEEEPDHDRLRERRRTALATVPAAIHRQAFEAMDRLIREHGSATGLTVMTGASDQLLERLIEILGESAECGRVLDDLAEKARNSRLPIGVLAALAGKGYATILVQRVLGMLPAASAIEDEHDVEVETAASAINSDVVADASALLTASGHSADVVSIFTMVALEPATLRDIHRARADIRGAAASPGSIHLDHGTGRPIIVPLLSEEYDRQLQRAEALVSLASLMPIRSATSQDAGAELAADPRFDPCTRPVNLARDLGCALWADDLGLRRLAREAGVSAFGTPALLIALNERAAQTAGPEDVGSIVTNAAIQTRELALDRLVDIRLGAGDLLRLAYAESWEPRSGALAVSRPSWWIWTPTPMAELGPLFAAVRSERPAALAAWQSSAMLGAARAILDPVACSRVLCLLAIVGWDVEKPAGHLRDSMQLARSVANRLSRPDPALELSTVAEGLQHRAGIRPEGIVQQVVELAGELNREAQGDGGAAGRPIL